MLSAKKSQRRVVFTPFKPPRPLFTVQRKPCWRVVSIFSHICSGIGLVGCISLKGEVEGFLGNSRCLARLTEAVYVQIAPCAPLRSGHMAQPSRRQHQF